MKPEEAKIEARAKIIWGEPSENVSAFLQGHGFGEKEIFEHLANFDRERAEVIRSSGIKKITMGALLIPIPLVAYIVFIMNGAIPTRLFTLTVLIGLYGIWKATNGIMMIMAPGTERGDLSDLPE
ncbi:MAG: hypothetical protein WC661_05855 [Opitutaceae bacterium]|jgi:hypothetical protein